MHSQQPNAQRRPNTGRDTQERDRRRQEKPDLSGAYKKKAHIHNDVDRNLRAFYATPKTNDSPMVHMGQVADPLSKMPRRRPESAGKDSPSKNPGRTATANTKTDPEGTRYFHVPSSENKKRPTGERRNTSSPHQSAGKDNRYAAFQREPEDGTRMFTTPEAGGEAVAETRGKQILDKLFHMFESVEERWQTDVDIVKRQALLHKKLVDHRRGLMLALTILLVIGLCIGCIYELIFVVRQVDTAGNSRYTHTNLVEASGLQEDMHIFGFTEAELSDRITFQCPYIRKVELTRQLPSTVTLTVEEDEIAYCANIFGETVALSAGLRVLGNLTEEEAASYILLRLPSVSEAIAGRPLVFTEERHERYIRLVLDEVTGSKMNGRVSYMDLRNEHELLLHCDNMYELQLGNAADLKMKLRMADTAIADPDFPQNTPARVDLRVVSEASVRADLRLELNMTP